MSNKYTILRICFNWISAEAMLKLIRHSQIRNTDHCCISRLIRLAKIEACTLRRQSFVVAYCQVMDVMMPKVFSKIDLSLSKILYSLNYHFLFQKVRPLRVFFQLRSFRFQFWRPAHPHPLWG